MQSNLDVTSIIRETTLDDIVSAKDHSTLNIDKAIVGGKLNPTLFALNYYIEPNTKATSADNLLKSFVIKEKPTAWYTSLLQFFGFYRTSKNLFLSLQRLDESTTRTVVQSVLGKCLDESRRIDARLWWEDRSVTADLKEKLREYNAVVTTIAAKAMSKLVIPPPLPGSQRDRKRLAAIIHKKTQPPIPKPISEIREFIEASALLDSATDKVIAFDTKYPKSENFKTYKETFENLKTIRDHFKTTQDRGSKKLNFLKEFCDFTRTFNDIITTLPGEFYEDPFASPNEHCDPIRENLDSKARSLRQEMIP